MPSWLLPWLQTLTSVGCMYLCSLATSTRRLIVTVRRDGATSSLFRLSPLLRPVDSCETVLAVLVGGVAVNFFEADNGYHKPRSCRFEELRMMSYSPEAPYNTGAQCVETEYSTVSDSTRSGPSQYLSYLTRRGSPLQIMSKNPKVCRF